MARRQPSYRQAQYELDRIERIISTAKDVSFGYSKEWLTDRKGDGVFYRWPRMRMDFAVFPYSDVSIRCHDCGGIIVERRDRLVGNAPRCLSREKLYKRDHHRHCEDCQKWDVRFCLSCGNKRALVEKANQQWNETRLLIGSAERVIYEQRKDSRTASRLHPVSDGGSKGGETNTRAGVDCY